jgi:hypothetical protein
MRYLLLTYYHKANGQIDEAMSVNTRVKTRDWQTANVILDFKDLKVLKCSMHNATVPKEWDRIVSYYYPFYTHIIERLFHENGHEIDLGKTDAVATESTPG